MRRGPLIALGLLLSLALAGPVAGAPPDGQRATIPPDVKPGQLVLIEENWEVDGNQAPRRLCVTVENRDSRTAHDTAAWAELFGGDKEMKRIALQRTPIEPSTLAPGDQGDGCVEAPQGTRGLFIRLRARWTETASGSRSGAAGPGQEAAQSSDPVILVPDAGH